MHQVSAEQLALLKVGELAKRTGKTVRAVHLYEELGLLAPADRSKGDSACITRAVTRIEWIAKLQALGFSLTEIKAFLREWEGSETAPAAIARLREMFSDKLHETRETICPAARTGERSARDADVHGQLSLMRAGARATRVLAPATSTVTAARLLCWWTESPNREDEHRS